MSNAELFRVVELPFCQALMFERWNPGPGRYFIGYRARHDFTAMMGNGVVDEFRTISGPILLAPTTIMGGIYDVGMRLGDARNVEAPIDQGWPPLTIGIDVSAPDRSDDWRTQMLQAIMQEKNTGAAPWKYEIVDSRSESFNIRTMRCTVGDRTAAVVIATDAPMLPEQLERLADTDNGPVTIAVSTANRLPPVAPGEAQQVNVVSEAQLNAILNAQ